MSVHEHRVWDRTVRVFHWLNFICVIFLSFIGTAIDYTRELGLSLQGNLLLKSLHVMVGYVFAVNLCWRICWGFLGGYHARWRQILPLGRNFRVELLRYVRGGAGPGYLAHNPLGRISVTLMLLALFVQGLSGLVLAGTDLYLPPFGHAIAKHIAAPGIDPSLVKPHVPEAMGAKEHAQMLASVDIRAYREVFDGYRRPFALAHQWGYYVLLLLAGVHIVAVVRAEIGGSPGIISAMFSGRKSIEYRPLPGGGHPNGPGSDARCDPKASQTPGE